MEVNQKRTKKTLLGSSGFTIIELMITIAVFGLVVPFITVMLTNLDQINDKARDLTTINALAENKVESLRSISFVGVPNGTTDFTAELPDSIAPPRSAVYNVSSVTPALKQIDVSITYNDHGESRTVSFRTYLGELGVGQY